MKNGRDRVAMVTGATGFVGSHLARRLINDGWQVHLIVRPDSTFDQLQGSLGSFSVHQHDGQVEQLISIMQESKPDIVFHLASVFVSEHKSEDIGPLIECNCLFGTQLLQAMQLAAVKYMVNAGTSWQNYQNEDYSPVNLYAATKQAFEDIVKYFSEVASMKVITLKLFDTYGPNDPRHKLIRLLSRDATTGKPLPMSLGEQLLDMVHVDDVVEAFLAASDLLAKGGGSGVYAVSSGKPVKLRDLVDAVERVSGKRLDVAWGEKPYRQREVMLPWEKGVPVPGWRPKITLENGLAALFGETGTKPDYGI